jgi:HlyD family secretion protein
MKRVVLAVVVLAGALVALITWRIRAQNRAEAGAASGSGVIEAEGVDLSARLSARVAKVLAREGQTVEQGAAVLELECDEPKARLLEAEARLLAAKAQAEAASLSARAARGQSAAAQASINAAGAQSAALEKQKELAARDAARLEAMGEQAAASARDRATATAEALSEQQRAAAASQAASRQQAGASVSQADAARAAADAARASVQALEAQVANALLWVSECTIRAPRAGVLERVYYDPGELVSLGAKVARLIDPARADITFYLANADVDQARVGMRASVQADAYPGRKFEGTIKRIGLEAEFTPRNVQTRSDRDRLVYPVEVLVKDHQGLLRTGMQAVVTLAEVQR